MSFSAWLILILKNQSTPKNYSVVWILSVKRISICHSWVKAQWSTPGWWPWCTTCLLGPLCSILFYNDFPADRQVGESVLYADDETDICSTKDPLELQNMIRHEANLSTEWLHDNKLVCSGSKTKLLVIGTREMRQPKLLNNTLKLTNTVAGQQVEETDDERLLGLIVNSTMTWHSHLYGRVSFSTFR